MLSTPDVPTCDVSDAMGDEAMILPTAFFDYGGRIDFCGPAITLVTTNDNTKVRDAVESDGEGRVLVVDNAGDLSRAMVGGNLAVLAAKNGWAGILVNGAVRDSHELVQEGVGIKALGTCPRKTEKRGLGDYDQPVTIGDVVINSGDWVTADADGVVITRTKPVT